jgi:hypothetical protein
LHWNFVTGSCNCVGTDCGCVQDNAGTLTSCGAGEPCCAGLTGSMRVSCSTTAVSCNSGGRIDCTILGVGYNEIPTFLPVDNFVYNMASSSMPDAVQPGGGTIGNQIFGTLNQNEQSLLSTTAIGSTGFTSSAIGTNLFTSASQLTPGVFSFIDIPLGGNWTASFQDTSLGMIGDSTWQVLTIGNYDVPELELVIREGLSGSGISAPGSLYDPTIINPQGCVNHTAGLSASWTHIGNAQEPIDYSWETVANNGSIIAYAPGQPVMGTNRDVLTMLSAPIGSIRSRAEDDNGCVVYSPFVDIPCSLEPLIGCQNPDAINYYFPANSSSCMCEPDHIYRNNYPRYTFTHNVRHQHPNVANSARIESTVQIIATNTNLANNTTNFVSWSADHSQGQVFYGHDPSGEIFHIIDANRGTYTLSASNCFNGPTSDAMLFSSSVVVQSLEVQGCTDPTDPAYAFEANFDCCCTCTYGGVGTAVPRGHYIQGDQCTSPGNGKLRVYISNGQGAAPSTNTTIRLRRSNDGGNTYSYWGGQVSGNNVNNGLVHTFTGLGAQATLYYKVEVLDCNQCPCPANAASTSTSTNGVSTRVFIMPGC